MGLPKRVFYTIHEAAARWGCTVSDIAGWAGLGTLKVMTGIPPVECGDRRAGGLVQIQPMDILPIFRRAGRGRHQHISASGRWKKPNGSTSPRRSRAS